MADEAKQSRKFRSVSLPTGILETVDTLIEDLRYWPSRSSFVREACLEKIRREESRLKELKAADARLSPGDKPRTT